MQKEGDGGQKKAAVCFTLVGAAHRVTSRGGRVRYLGKRQADSLVSSRWGSEETQIGVGIVGVRDN